MEFSRSFARLALIGIIALLILSQGLHAPFEKDEESRPASIISDILHRGDWMLPADSYGEVTRKPPLYYWISASIARLREVGPDKAGPDEAGARIVSIGAAAGVSIAVAAFAYGAMGSLGALAFLFLLGTYGFAAHAAYARTDMLFTFLVFATYCLIYPEVEGERVGGAFALAGFILGLAVLTKGPLAIVLIALGLLIYELMARRNPLRIAARWRLWAILAIAIVIAAFWYVPAFIATHGLIARVQIGQENLGHLLPANLGGTGEGDRPFYYIAARFIGACAPLCLYIPAIIAMAWRWREMPRPVAYQMAFLIGVLALFSIAGAKRDDYILPAFPAFAIVLAALFWPGVSRAVRVLRDIATAIAAIGMLAMAVGALYLNSNNALLAKLSANLQSSDAAYLALYVQGFWHSRQAALTIAIVAGATVSLILIAGRRSGAAAGAIALASIAAVSLWIGTIRPGLAERRTLRGFTATIRSITNGQSVGTPYGSEYEVAYYYGRPIVHVDWADFSGGPKAPRYLLLWKDQIARLRGVAANGQIVAVAPPALDGRELVLWKVVTKPFETIPKAR